VLQQCCGSRFHSLTLGAILEILVEAAQQSKNVVHLVESVRQSLGRGAGTSVARRRRWAAGVVLSRRSERVAPYLRSAGCWAVAG